VTFDGFRRLESAPDRAVIFERAIDDKAPF
jgi:hypothetical protein